MRRGVAALHVQDQASLGPRHQSVQRRSGCGQEYEDIPQHQDALVLLTVGGQHQDGNRGFGAQAAADFPPTTPAAIQIMNRQTCPLAQPDVYSIMKLPLMLNTFHTDQFVTSSRSIEEQIKMSRKILFADDHDYIRVLLEQTLEVFEDNGVELLPASNGTEAWDTVQAERPDVVILDVMMPGMSGFEVCKYIKSDPDFSHAHVIMLTARGQASDHELGVEMGANEYITKPFSPKRLIKLVANVLNIETL